MSDKQIKEAMRVNKLMELDLDVKPKDRTEAKHSIEKMKKFKNK